MNTNNSNNTNNCGFLVWGVAARHCMCTSAAAVYSAIETPPKRTPLCTMHYTPVSIPRFPLRRFSPGAGLLRNPFVHR